MAGNDSKDGRRRTGVHNRLPVLRAERGVSRSELAQAVGVNAQTIGFVERGDYGPSLELALRICAYFELPIEAVFSLAPFVPMSAQLYPTRSGEPT
ncbi:helix-turn-helix transcriptional regulator [Actinoplanes aureus]|uniref:Helix-turn-helix transcriptional regulator n=1 Tax=Actinoplanes aureus TaxID=2792083 RepID=A0A931CC35_9ACTN|nr:helix-turn-helix transcriptional regulator [Actinoplanes aureus]MBG0567324.1 helix-turn-helix transcriptional regulator [Actinoplanes aureus]